MNRSFRAKRMVSEGRVTKTKVERIEKRCLKALRAYDSGKEDVETVLDAIADYDHLITPDRPPFLDQYRTTLEAKPWKSCPCNICKTWGSRSDHLSW